MNIETHENFMLLGENNDQSNQNLIVYLFSRFEKLYVVKNKKQNQIYGIIKLKMEMRNVSKRQQPDHRADKSRMPPMVLQCSEKPPHPVEPFSWPLYNYVY